jgi:hypothetical protein
MERDMEGLARKTLWMENMAQLRLVSNMVSDLLIETGSVCVNWVTM